MALSCFLLPPGICLTSKIIHCHQLREYYFIRIFCSIFHDYLESRIIHLVYKLYTALSVNHMMTSPFIIEKFEPVFQKYHYMSYSHILYPQDKDVLGRAVFFSASLFNNNCSPNCYRYFGLIKIFFFKCNLSYFIFLINMPYL